MTTKARGNGGVLVVAGVLLAGVIAVGAYVLYAQPWSTPIVATNDPVPPPPPPPHDAGPNSFDAGVRVAQADDPQTDAERHAAADEAARQAAHGMPPPVVGLGGAEHFSATLTITEANGITGIGPGTTCNLLFQYGEAVNRLRCRATIQCGEQDIYGVREGKGFFACTAFSTQHRLVIGNDPQPSSADGDPSFSVDTTQGTLTLSDASGGPLGQFSLRGTVVAPTAPPPGAGYGS